MAKEPKVQAPAAITEIIPSQADRVSGIASASAPFIYTDWVSNQGYNAGVATFTLEALRNMTVGDKTIRDRVVVAHLRMPIHTMRAFKNAIEQVELMMKPVAESKKN
jgi:hypothetical protein